MRFLKIIVCSLAVAPLCSAAWGQQPGRGQGRRPQARQQLAPERAEAAWQWQAKGVAHELELSAEDSKKLVEAYVAGRKHFRDAVREMRQRPPEGDEPGAPGAEPGEQRDRRRLAWERRTELLGQERESLASGLQAFLTEEQASQAMKSLGTFSGSWDVLVDRIAGLKLESEKMHAALVPIRKYVTDLAALRESGDRQAMRQGMREARERMNAGLGEVLTDEQMKQFREATSRRGERPRGRSKGNEQ
jgi:hypothetical protein